MPDKRSVDELSIEELERILAIKKREARQSQLRRMQRTGRIIDPDKPAAPPPDAAARPAPAAGTKAARSRRSATPTDDPVPQFEDLVDQNSFRGKAKREDNLAWRRFINRTLLALEVAAVIGLVLVGVTMLNSIGTLQQETAQAQASAQEQLRSSIPTIAPTPQLQLANIVLPGGHTPPTEPGGGQFNFEEIPENMRSLVRDQIFLPNEIERPPTLPETPRRIIIPEIDVDQVIVQGVDWEALKLGVGQLPNGVTPSDREGNVVLAAHNDIYGEIFRHLDQLEPGMEFQIQTERSRYNYVITGIDIVDPTDVHVMQSQGRPTATLISCYPYQVNNKRIVVFADLVTS